MIVERAGLGSGVGARDGRDVRPLAQQVDLDQVGLAGQDGSLLLPVLIEALVAGGLVGRADDFDRGHQPILAAPSLADLEE